nr:hypothetical protein [Tanacetum cinerariifolium]
MQTWVIHQLKPIKHPLLVNHLLLDPEETKAYGKQRKEADVSHAESEDEDHVLTPSSDPLPSGEDSYTLNELMGFCTSLQEKVFDLQERLMKIGSGRRVKSPLEKDSLGAQEDASKQGRVIEEIEQDDEIALDVDTQGRKNGEADDLSGEEVVLDTTTGEHEEQIIEDVSTAEPVTTAGEVVTTIADKVSAAPTTDIIEDVSTAEPVTTAGEVVTIDADKSTKPKVVVQEKEVSTKILAAATTVTTIVPTLRAKGIVFHKQKQSHIPTVSSSKDKGKGKMTEPEVPIKKKDQMRMDEEYEADSLLAERLQARERKEFSEEQKASGKEGQESSTKRTAESLEFDISKKQKIDENIELVIDDTEELKKCMEIVPHDGDEVLIEATPLSSRSPTIVDFKIHKEGNKTYFKIIRADGNSQVYQTFEKMFKNFNREDLKVM